MKKLIQYIAIFLMMCVFSNAKAQITPSSYENIDYLMTFGKGADSKWGDDDNVQIHFFVVPKSETKPVYIRVYDPDTGGKHDTKNGGFDTKCTFSLYAGRGVHSTKAARQINPVTGYDKGRIVAQKTFGNESTYDGEWYTFGPVNPSEGEYSDQFKGYIFKMICKGGSGNDGNAYKYCLSYSKTQNLFVDQGNIFTYEMSFKLKSTKSNVAHVYPFIEDNIEAITQHNFDADSDLQMRVTSVGRKLVNASVSGDGTWAKSKYIIKPKEVNTSMDIQMIKQSQAGNDMVIYIMNQYKEAMPLFSVPIGGKPKYQHDIKVKSNFR